ncbi:MAG: adenylyl-sulfate reductase [Rhodospirillaceae bacterium]|nr:adenylyl-sulfate reductase [Rhodospirillaceae bacterium]
MFASNPIADLATIIPLDVIQGYVILMFILVVGGTILDMIHKSNAKFFFAKAKAAEASRTRELGAGEKIGIAVSTGVVDMATSGEFCNPRRRISHLFTMYGFVLFLTTTVALVFAYPTHAAPAIVSQLWHLGAAMVMFGGYWFWFCIRVDVTAEGVPWNRIVKADLFILSLLGTTTFGLVWSILYSKGVAPWSTVSLALFIISATVLFGGVYWSKFAHMFFKPAAAFNKRIIKADGSRENLPEIGDLTDPELQKRFPDIPEYMGSTPPNMGPGIKREAPRHY